LQEHALVNQPLEQAVDANDCPPVHELRLE
jgi:hypothetical protein